MPRFSFRHTHYAHLPFNTSTMESKSDPAATPLLSGQSQHSEKQFYFLPRNKSITPVSAKCVSND